MKKYLLGLGSLTAIVIPVATTVACGGSSDSDSSSSSISSSNSNLNSGGRTIQGTTPDGKPYYHYFDAPNGALNGQTNYADPYSARGRYIIGFTNSGFPIFEIENGEYIIGYSSDGNKINESNMENFIPINPRSLTWAHNNIPVANQPTEYISPKAIFNFIEFKGLNYFTKYVQFSRMENENPRDLMVNSIGSTALGTSDEYVTINYSNDARSIFKFITFEWKEYFLWLMKNCDKYNIVSWWYKQTN